MSPGDRYAVEAQDPRSEPMSHVSRPNPAMSPTFQEGEQVGGRYEVIERIGEGNYAVTYRGRDTTLGRTVALKILRSQYASDPTFVSRFEREARVAASVFHPNIVDVYDYGAHDGTFFIAMQYVAGEDLKHALQARGRFSATDAVQVARQILRGLGAIHSAGIIHRDIKPQNILVGRDGVVRVTDFGIAHHAVETALTSHGTTVGTASYMAPEQARGGALSEATDLYAVGVVLFELLTGRLPFEAANPMAVMLAHLQKPAPTPSDVVPDADVPPAIEAVVMRALQKAPGERYQTAAEMMRDLDASSETGQGATAALAAFGLDDPGATTHLPVAAAAEGVGSPSAPQFARPAVPQSPSETPAAVPIMPPRRRRRDLGWLGPLIFFGVALATLGGVLAANLGGFGDGSTGGRDRGTGVPAVVAASPTKTASVLDLGPLPTSTPTPTLPPPTTAPTATVMPSVTPSPTSVPPTNTPRPSPTATATPRPAPTSTPRPAPTATPRPTATAIPPTAEPTPIPVDVDPPIGQASGGGNSGSGNAQVIEPITEDDAVAPATGGGSQTFPASQWTGETTPVQSSMYGRPAVAVYGGQSASLTFQLDTVPASGATLSITGLDDEYGPVQIAVDVNGQAGVTGQLFTDWGGDWNSISWSSAVIDIPAGVLREGTNTVTMRNLQQDARQYFLIDETRIETAYAAAQSVSFSSASQNISSGRGSNKKGNDNGRKGREKD